MKRKEKVDFVKFHINRENEKWFFSQLYDFWYFDRENFEKLLQYSYEIPFSERQLQAKVIDVFEWVIFLWFCHKNKKDVFRIENFREIKEQFSDYFWEIRKITEFFLLQKQ